jgi:hypothetical protein
MDNALKKRYMGVGKPRSRVTSAARDGLCCRAGGMYDIMESSALDVSLSKRNGSQKGPKVHSAVKRMTKRMHSTSGLQLLVPPFAMPRPSVFSSTWIASDYSARKPWSMILARNQSSSRGIGIEPRDGLTPWRILGCG